MSNKTEITQRIQATRDDLANMRAKFSRTYEITLSWKIVTRQKQLNALLDELATLEQMEAYGHYSQDMKEREFLTQINTNK